MPKMIEKLNDVRNILVFITALSAAGGVIYGAVNFVDSRYALAEDVQKLEERLTLAELKDLLHKALENLYFYKSQIRKYPEDEELKERLKEAQAEVDSIKKRIEAIEKKQRGEE
jgi:hypothetical protein